MLQCDCCGYERPDQVGALNTIHRECIRQTENRKGVWRQVADRVYSGGNTSAANPMRVAEAEMQKFLAREFNQIGQANCQHQAAVDQIPGSLIPNPTAPPLPWCSTCDRGGHQESACELGNLRRENVALQAEMKRCHDEDARLRHNLTDMATQVCDKVDEISRLKRELACNTNEVSVAFNTVRENVKLKMELADAKEELWRRKESGDKWIADNINEMEWMKREIARLDPRLARARWGK